MNKIQPVKRFEQQLKERFPTLFSEIHDINFYCPPGWQQIVESVCIQLSNAPGFENVKCVQVKEKFGGLRFYIESDSGEHRDIYFEIIDKAEFESFQTCECCGSKQNVGRTRNGYIETTCESCWKDPNLHYHRNPTWKKI